MKRLIATSFAILFLLTAGYAATTTVTEQLSHDCNSGADYRNSWRDVYFIGEWWPHRDDDKSFLACEGVSTYLRYHPYDLAATSLLAAAAAGYYAYRNETMTQRITKQKK